MKRGFIFIATVLFMLFTSNAYSQLSATATSTDATCPSNGSITINASGGTTPYSYSINGGASWQPSNQFTILIAGTYNVIIKDDGGSTYTVSGVIVKDAYNDMTPTAAATNEVCAGSNTGSIKLTMPSGQGTAPYTYSVITGPTQPAPVSTSSTSYTFQNLAPGYYQVRVADACGAFQTREATLVAANTYDLNVSVWARPSECGQMDYYVQPGLGTHFPHTYYAYAGGNLVQTIQVTSADFVTIPGTTINNAFKFTLPYPTTFPGTYYTFKYTDACVTDANNSRVRANTPNLGSYQISTTTRSCALDMDVKLLEGWKLSATVTIKAADGTTYTKNITDEATRIATFSGLPAGSYNVEIKDGCNHIINTTYNLQQQNLGGVISTTCGGNIPGTISIDISGLEQGWQTPVTATITSGPASYFSSFMNQTFTASYPVSAQPMINNIIRFTNMAPGTYTIKLTDGCNEKTITYVASGPGAVFNIPPETVGGCSGSRKIISTSSSSCTTGLSANVRKGTSETTTANGLHAESGFTLTNVVADVYSIYYYSGISNVRTSVFTIPTSDIYEGNFLVKKSTVAVTDAPTNPKVSSAISAKCSDGSVSVKLIPDPQSTNITGYQLQNPDGSFTPIQTSPVFTVTDYGTYNFRTVDECGNAGVSAIAVSPNPIPEVKTSGNTCLGGDINLYVDLTGNATAVWTKPNGSTVQGAQLLIQNASEADKGTYSVKVTYTVGTCTEVVEKTFVLDNCVALPVNWGSLSATIKNDMLYINWSTIKETNNSYFEIQISKDGSTWKTIGRVNSTALDGNSDAEIKYQFTSKLADVMNIVAIPALLGLLALGFKRKNSMLKAITGLTIVASLIFGCNKSKHDVISESSNSRIWVKIVQVDIDGKQKTSGIVQAIRE